MHICCVCTGNTCRSPMLACLLKAAADKHNLNITICSAGVAASMNQAASSQAILCMERRQLDLTDHRSMPVQSLEVKSIDRFYCMSDNHALALYDAGIDQKKLFVVNAANGGVPDPFGGSIEVYEECAMVLEETANDIIAELRGNS